jgi:chromosomal replication initiator protein
MKLWQQFLHSLEPEFGKDVVDKWLNSLLVVRFDACNLYLEAKDAFQASFFEEHIRPLIKSNFLNQSGHPVKVHLSYPGQKVKAPAPQQNIFATEIKPDNLDPTATFSSFFSEEKNLAVFNLLSELVGFDSEKKEWITPTLDKGTFNPIVIYGPSGCGKTHLLMATASRMKEQNLRAFFVKADTFSHHVVQGFRFGNMQEVRDIYRYVDVLIVDDIQIFAKKTATQEEFFHTFNALHMQKKQIILSTNIPPGQLTQIEPRLISRFEWGLTLSLEKPGIESLKKILEKKMLTLKVQFSEDIIEFILKNFTSTTALQKALEAIILRSHLQKEQNFTLAFVKTLVLDLLEEQKSHEVTPEKIVAAIAGHFGIKTQDILGKSQSREMSFPRQLSMYFCRKKLDLPFTAIGGIFQRDHSTVMSNIKQIEKMVEDKQKEVFSLVLDIEKKLEKSSL